MKHFSMRAAKSTYIVFTIIWAIPFLISLLSIYKMPMNKSLWLMEFIIISFAAFLMLWIYKFKIIITNTSVIYESLFNGVKEINLLDIEKATIKVGINKYTDRFLPPVRIEIKTKSNNEKLAINIKVFNKNDVVKLIETVNAK
jgi:hypothetical protein